MAADASKESQKIIAQKTWELTNNIERINSNETLYRYDKDQQMAILAEKLWEDDPCYFKNTRISAPALLKIVMHARSGRNLEVMGLLLGKIDANTILVMDSFALPVEGTETYVNAQAQAYEYMTEYIEAAKKVERNENVIGWYHSHPGYGCWLSGIDVATQMLNQKFQDPFLALVVDPIRTVSAGKVCIGAFRTYPMGHKAETEQLREYQPIPLDRIQNFGVNYNKYYPLNVSYFKSSLEARLLDSLWNEYWINTLSSSPLLANSDFTNGQIFDLTKKLEQSESYLECDSTPDSNNTLQNQKTDDKLLNAAKDSCRTTTETINGLMTEMIKDKIFNYVKRSKFKN